MANTNLTPKQEKFCQVYLETGNATEAYRQSYDAENMKDTTINRKAKGLIDQGNIRARLEELREPIRKRHECTIDTLLAELEEARQLGLATSQVGATVSASMGKAKIMGLDKQVIDHQTQGGPLTFTWITPNNDATD